MSADHAGSHASPPTPPEPETPLWLTALGAVLFALVGVWWLATPSAATADASGSAAADAGAPAASAAPAPGAPAK
jgi:hypothetical protein